MVEPPREYFPPAIVPRGGLNVETRFAGVMAKMINPTRINPDSFRELVRPFTMSMRTDEPNLQEAIRTREALHRFTQTLALTLSKGSVERAKQLLGSEYDSFLDRCLDDQNYVTKVNQILSTMGMYSP